MLRRNRREFLEDSMLATAAAVAAETPARLFAADPQPSASPNARLGVAVVGLRGRGGSHIGAFTARRDTEVLYLCDVDLEVGLKRTAEVAKRQGRRPRYEPDLRRVLEDPRVDIVSIATPHHLHALQAIWAMQAGKDVYVEKPIGHNVSEGARIVEAARRYKRICQVGLQCRSNPGMIAAMAFLHSGGLGTIHRARGICCQSRARLDRPGDYPLESAVDYNLWLGPAQPAPLTRRQLHYQWHWFWEYGNGELGHQGVHQMDLARWALGDPGWSRSVLSFGGRIGEPDGGETPDTQVVLHDYGRQSLVLELRSLPSEPFRGVRVGVIVECEGGYLVVSRYDGGAAFDLQGRTLQEFRGGADHFANFLQAVRSRNPHDLNSPPELGHVSSGLCHLGNISYRLGAEATPHEIRACLDRWATRDELADTWERMQAYLVSQGIEPSRRQLRCGPQLAFDPESETITEDQTANGLLTRDYRPPFVVPAAGQV